MIYLSVRESEIIEAREFARMVDSLKKGLASTVAATKDYQIIGKLGEEIVKRYFDTIGVRYEEPNEVYGRHNSDSCDLIVEGKKVDVKSSKKYKQITLNERQWKKTYYKGIDYMVGVWFSDDLRSATIYGYGVWEDMQRDIEKDFEWNGSLMPMYSLPVGKIRSFKVDNLII